MQSQNAAALIARLLDHQMKNTQTGTLGALETSTEKGWQKTDTMWMLGLYGTAIGAGVLFLPINAGVGGLLPLIIMAILAFPLTFLHTAR